MTTYIMPLSWEELMMDGFHVCSWCLLIPYNIPWSLDVILVEFRLTVCKWWKETVVKSHTNHRLLITRQNIEVIKWERRSSTWCLSSNDIMSDCRPIWSPYFVSVWEISWVECSLDPFTIRRSYKFSISPLPSKDKIIWESCFCSKENFCWWYLRPVACFYFESEWFLEKIGRSWKSDTRSTISWCWERKCHASCSLSMVCSIKCNGSGSIEIRLNSVEFIDDSKKRRIVRAHITLGKYWLFNCPYCTTSRNTDISFVSIWNSSTRSFIT